MCSSDLGGIAKAVESGCLRRGVMYECVRAGVPFVLAGSLRDDGPLPDTITDMNRAQDAYAEQLKGAGLVLCLGSMLHSIAVGNMLPSWVKIVCVDIHPAVVTKVSDPLILNTIAEDTAEEFTQGLRQVPALYPNIGFPAGIIVIPRGHRRAKASIPGVRVEDLLLD